MARGKYKRKRERKLLREMRIDQQGLPARVTNILKAADIVTLMDLSAFSDEELKKIPGIGSAALKSIHDMWAEKGALHKQGREDDAQ